MNFNKYILENFSSFFSLKTKRLAFREVSNGKLSKGLHIYNLLYEGCLKKSLVALSYLMALFCV
jgi:hypothetical protein